MSSECRRLARDVTATCNHAHLGTRSIVTTKHYVHAQQTCSTTANKSWCVDVWTVIMTVEATDLKQSGCCCKTTLPGPVTREKGSWFGQHYISAGNQLRNPHFPSSLVPRHCPAFHNLQHGKVFPFDFFIRTQGEPETRLVPVAMNIFSGSLLSLQG